MKPINKKQTRTQSSGLKPYIVDSVDHIKANPATKPLHMNVNQVVNAKRNTKVTEEIHLKSDFLELVEDEQQAYNSRKNRLLNKDHSTQTKARASTRYQPKKAHAVVFKRNMLGLKKEHKVALADCSVKGTSIISASAYKKGAIIDLNLHFATSEHPFNFSAKVIYSENATSSLKSSKKEYTTGFKFIDTTTDYKDFIIKEALVNKLRHNQ